MENVNNDEKTKEAIINDQIVLFKVVLTALRNFFIKIGADFHAEWVARDILLFDKEKSVGHHLEAFKGGMGSVFNDFCICVENKYLVTYEQEVWANRIFSILTGFSHIFAIKLSKRKTPTLDDIKKESWSMALRDCAVLIAALL